MTLTIALILYVISMIATFRCMHKKGESKVSFGIAIICGSLAIVLIGIDFLFPSRQQTSSHNSQVATQSQVSDNTIADNPNAGNSNTGVLPAASNASSSDTNVLPASSHTSISNEELAYYARLLDTVYRSSSGWELSGEIGTEQIEDYWFYMPVGKNMEYMLAWVMSGTAPQGMVTNPDFITVKKYVFKSTSGTEVEAVLYVSDDGRVVELSETAGHEYLRLA